MTSIKTTAWKSAVLAIGAAAVGLGINLVRPDGVEIGRSVVEVKAERLEAERARALGEARNSAPDPVSGGNQGGAAIRSEDLEFRLDLGQVAEIHEAGAALFLDARPGIYFENGHIPGALSIPHDEYDERIFEIADRLPLDRPIIIYCDGGDCTSSMEVAERLLDEGYTNVHLYEGGFPEWEAAGREVREGMEP